MLLVNALLGLLDESAVYIVCCGLVCYLLGWEW